MSDDQPANATTESSASAPDPPAASGGGNTRTLVLLGLLAIAVSALLYDYVVARPASEAAHVKLLDEASDRSGSDKEQLTNKEVAELLGKSPAEELKGDHYYIERYAWMGGLPWRSYDCWVVYSPANDGTTSSYRFNSAYLNEPPEDQFMPGYKAPIGEPDPNLPPDPTGAGGGAGGGGRRGGGPPGGGADGGLGGGDGRPGRPPGEDGDGNSETSDDGEAKKEDAEPKGEEEPAKKEDAEPKGETEPAKKEDAEPKKGEEEPEPAKKEGDE